MSDAHLVGRVVVGVHGSPGSLHALRFAVGQAQTLGAVLVPVIAWQPPGGDSAGRRYPSFLTDEWADAAENRLLAAFEDGLGTPPQRLEIQPQVVRGPAGRVLVAVADRNNDILVIGPSRRGPLHRAFYGSPARYCAAHAQCTVVLVPPSPLLADAARPWRGKRLRHAPRDGSELVGGFDAPAPARPGSADR